MKCALQVILKSLLLFLLQFYFVFTVIGQNISVGQSNQVLSVFLDCQTHFCDYDHFRREIRWVNWVRDREDSEVHILITSQSTGSGGRLFTIDYIGQNGLKDMDKTLLYTSDPYDTDTEVRNRLGHMIALGLIQFVENREDISTRIKITYEEPEEGVKSVSMPDDPWNLWVYRIGVEGSLEGESQERAYSLEARASAVRVSEDHKFIFVLDGEYDKEDFEDLEEGESYTSIREDYRMEILSVWSLNPKWSLGLYGEVNHSSFFNRDLGVFAGPAIEYNIFPYRESNRRSLTFSYSAQLAAYDYELVTIEGKSDEFLGFHRLEIGTAVQQPWGEIFASIEGIQYLNELSAHRINTFLRLEYRLFKGFNVDIFGRFSRIKDQFYLPAEDLTPEEILLRRRQRETAFRYDIGIGFSYRFGSKFANIVNPRMN